MARTRIVNNAVSYLVGDINDTVLSLTVSDASDFPSLGDFVIIVDNEIMLVTNVVADTFTVTRGYEGTTAVPHSDGAVVAHILTAGNLQSYIRNTVPLFADANAPLMNTMVNDSGTVLTASSFTAVNQGSSTLADYNAGGVYCYIPASVSNSVRIYTKSPPSTPYTVIAQLGGHLPTGSGMFGVGFRENSTGKLWVVTNRPSGAVVQKWTDATTYINTYGNTYYVYGPVWLKMEDDGSDLYGYVSHDGMSWTELWTEGRTVHMSGGPDEICIVGNTNNNTSFKFGVHNWIEE